MRPIPPQSRNDCHQAVETRSCSLLPLPPFFTAKTTYPPSLSGFSRIQAATTIMQVAPDIQNAWVTELHVRMDCNGCVNKVKKAIHGLEGIYETRIDYDAQIVTVTGRASPEQLVRAIRKGARKAAAVNSHTGPPADQPPPPPAEEAPAPAAAEPAPPEVAAPPAEEAPAPPPPAEAAPPPAENIPNPEAPTQQPPEGAVEEKPMVHTYPYHEWNRGQQYWNGYDGYDYHVPRETAAVPYYVSGTVHSYNTYTPPPTQPQYFVVEHGYNHVPSQPPDQRLATGYYHGESQYQRPHGGDRMGAMFSDENPNACCIS